MTSSVALRPSATVVVGNKGRLVLPVQIRRAAGIEPEATLVARADGAGKVTLETLDAVQAEVWAGAPQSSSTSDATADIRAMRDADARASKCLADARSAAATSPDAGDRLLAHLGLQ